MSMGFNGRFIDQCEGNVDFETDLQFMRRFSASYLGFDVQDRMEALVCIRLRLLLPPLIDQHFLSPNLLRLINQRDPTRFPHLVPPLLVPLWVLLPSRISNPATRFPCPVPLLVLLWVPLASPINRHMPTDLHLDSFLEALVSCLGKVPDNLWVNLSLCTDQCLVCRGRLQ